jgi:predicted NodU family carbamoyl transferase
MIVLGIAEGDGAGAALVVEGRVRAWAPQEALDRVPGSRAFPAAAVDAVLDLGGVSAREVDRVAVVGTLDVPGAEGEGGIRARGVQAVLRGSGLWRLREEVRRARMVERLRGLGIQDAAVETVEHDRAHASAVYRSQARSEALVVTLDTSGDGAAVTVSVARHLQLDRVLLQTSLASIAEVPASVARHLGVTVRQLSPLAGAGRVEPALRDAFASLLAPVGEGFRRWLPARDPMPTLLSGHRPEQVAASLEQALGDALTVFLARWTERTRIADVCLAGRLAEDPRLVGVLARTPGLRSLWTGPWAGDPGLSVGAALHGAGAACEPWDGEAHGAELDARAATRALSAANLPRAHVEDPDAALAAHLRAGRVGARAVGRVGAAENGARALLCRADDPGAVARLRAALGWPAHLVPAVAVHADDGPSRDGLPEALTATARTAGAALPAAPWLAARARAACSADGRCTVLRVRSGDPLAAILRALGPDVPLAVAPLTVPGESTAWTAMDAVRAWTRGVGEVAVVGPYLLERVASTGGAGGSGDQSDAQPANSSPDR